MYPEGQESTQVASNKSFGDVQVTQFEAVVSQVAHEDEQAVQTCPFAKNPSSHAD